MSSLQFTIYTKTLLFLSFLLFLQFVTPECASARTNNISDSLPSKKDTAEEIKKILKDIVNETIENESNKT